MKIAVSSTGKNIKDNVSDVFARCPYFIMAEISARGSASASRQGPVSFGKDQKIEKIETIKNESINQMSGAGISAAQLMAEKNVNAVITGNVGPRALDVLKQFNIEIYAGEGVIKEAIQDFIDGKLKKI